MPQRWSRPGLDGGLAGARAGRAARNGARARASHGEGGVEGKYSKEQGGRVSKMAVDRALSRGHAGHGRREGVSAALCPARMRNACGTWARSAICMRLVLRMSSVFSVLAGERVACRVRRFYPRSRSSILYRITIVEVSDLIVIAHPPWRSLERQARPRGRHGQRHARPGNLSGNVTRPGPHGWSPRPAPYSSRSALGTNRHVCTVLCSSTRVASSPLHRRSTLWCKH